MGAGHPRMSFELDTFTAIQPAHYKIDNDYRKRKIVANGIQTWAIGQAIAMERRLDALLDPKRNKDGIFPELVLYDCQACHHSLMEQKWQSRPGTGLLATRCLAVLLLNLSEKFTVSSTYRVVQMY